jgi:hypothetical protein
VLTDIAIAIAVVALVVAGYATWSAMGLAKRLEAALGGTSTESLESTLGKHLKRVNEVDHRLAELASEYTQLSTAQSLSSQKISIVRFNPFGDTGGDQSFTLAVLDAHDSGYVITSIHGREGTRVYVKPIDFGTSKYQLSAEEKQAMTQAAKRSVK